MNKTTQAKFDRARKHLEKAVHFSNGGKQHGKAINEMAQAAKEKLALLEAGHNMMVDIGKDIADLRKQGVLINEYKLILREIRTALKKINTEKARTQKQTKAKAKADISAFLGGLASHWAGVLLIGFVILTLGVGLATEFTALVNLVSDHSDAISTVIHGR